MPNKLWLRAAILLLIGVCVECWFNLGKLAERSTIISSSSRLHMADEMTEIKKAAEEFLDNVESGVQAVSNFVEERRPLKTALLGVAARSVRGEFASEEDKTHARELVSKLEALNPTQDPASSELTKGKWELVYCNTYPFRASPFFMAARAVCRDGEQVGRFNTFCDLHRQALAFSSIGKVTQVITNKQLVSEVETNGAVLPGLPIVVKGTIQSAADIEDFSNSSIYFQMDKVRIKSGTSNVPLLKEFLDGFSGLSIKQLGDFLEQRVSGYTNPMPGMNVTYVDAHMRISRDQDNNIFVFNRIT